MFHNKDDINMPLCSFYVIFTNFNDRKSVFSWVIDYFPKQRVHRHTRLSLSTGPTDTTINWRFLVRYRGDVLAYAHSNRFGPLRILICCYYY